MIIFFISLLKDKTFTQITFISRQNKCTWNRKNMFIFFTGTVRFFISICALEHSVFHLFYDILNLASLTLFNSLFMFALVAQQWANKLLAHTKALLNVVFLRHIFFIFFNWGFLFFSILLITKCLLQLQPREKGGIFYNTIMYALHYV